MLSKLKLAYQLSPIVFMLIISFLIYLLFQYSDRLTSAQNKANELDNKVSYLEHQAKLINDTIEQNAKEKQALENESIKQQEQINELLKNNKCANDIVPATIFDKLYKRADKIRQPTSSDKSN